MKITFLGNFQVSFSSESHHAASLEALGHQVIRLQEAETSAETILDWALSSQLFVWVHTHGWQTPGQISMLDVLNNLKNANIPTVTYHLDLWKGIAREKDLETDPFYKHIQHFFTVDKLMADWFNENTEVEGHYLPAGVFGPECIMLPPNQEPMNDVIFVGSRNYHPEWQWRPQLIDWLKETYGDRFKHYGGDSSLGIVRGLALNQLYANTKVVIGDTLCLNFDYPYYFSDRLYETTGRGGFLLMPKIIGLDQQFTDDQIGTFKFGDFTDLKNKINFYLKNDVYREAMRKNGFLQTKYRYTYENRWKTILKEVGLS
jgi:hypothetical protein